MTIRPILVPRAAPAALRRMFAALPIAALVASAGPALATDLLYAPLSPNFGGTNGIALQMAQQQNSLIAQHRAAQAQAAAQAASGGTTGAAAAALSASQSFANMLTSQISALVARNIADKIANSQTGGAGTVIANGVVITYVNVDGQLTVNMTTDAGTTTFSVPTGN